MFFAVLFYHGCKACASKHELSIAFGALLPVSVWKPNKETQQCCFFSSPNNYLNGAVSPPSTLGATLSIVQQHGDDIWVLLANTKAKLHEMKESNNDNNAQHGGFHVNKRTEERPAFIFHCSLSLIYE